MNKLKSFQNVWKSPLLWLLFLAVIYVCLRVFHILELPIFTDEAIYVRWAQIGEQDANWRFISLTDGKQPLFTWLMMIFIRVVKEPLLAGRLTSVISGLFSLIGLYFLGSELFKSRRIGVITSALYVIYPFALMYDRMALYDSLVATLFIWSTYLSVCLVRYVRLDYALLLGISLGLGMLNKTTGFFSLYLLPLSVILFDWKKKERMQRILRLVGFMVISAVISQILYSILRLSPYLYIVSQKDAIFVYPFKEWIQHPTVFLMGNLHGMFDWLVSYLTWPLCGVAILSLGIGLKSWKEKVLCFLYWVIPFVGLAVFGRVLYPRYIFFMTMPLLCLCAFSLYWIFQFIKKRSIILALCITVLLFIPSFRVSYGILFDIKNAPVTTSDRGQYINDWPSGWGVKEIVSYLSQKAETEKMTVFTEGTFGLLPYALEIYLVDNPNITIVGLWPLSLETPEAVKVAASKGPTYFVMNQTQFPPNWSMDKIGEYQKGNNKTQHMRLYKLTSQ